MRHGTANNRRQRGGRNGGGNNSNRRGGQQRTQVFDSNGPEVRIRGTAHQVHEKYLALAKDAASVGDTVLAESYLQHSEHYQRLINSWAVDEAEKAEAQKNNEPNEGKNGNNNQQQNKKRTDVQADKKPAKQDDDLALPASILGDNAQASDQEEKVEASA